MASNRSLLGNALNQRIHLEQPRQPQLHTGGSIRLPRAGGGESVNPGRARSVRLPGLSRPEAIQRPNESPAATRHGGGGGGGHPRFAEQPTPGPQAQGTNSYGGPADEDPAVTHAHQMLAQDAINEPARKVAAAMQTIGDKMAAGAYSTPGPNGQPGMPNANAMMADALQAGLAPQQLTPLIAAMNFTMTAQTKAASGALFGALGQTLNENPHTALTTEELFKQTMAKVPPELRQYVDPKQAIDHLQTFSHAMVGNMADEIGNKVQLGQMSPQDADKVMKPILAGAVGSGTLGQKDADTIRQQMGLPQSGTEGDNAQALAKGLTGQGAHAQAGWSSTAQGQVFHDDPTTGERTLYGTFQPDGSFKAEPKAVQKAGGWGAFGQAIEQGIKTITGQGGMTEGQTAPGTPEAPQGQPADQAAIQAAQQAATGAAPVTDLGGATPLGATPATRGVSPSGNPAFSNPAPQAPQNFQQPPMNPQAAQPQPPPPAAGGASVKDMVNPQDPMKAKLLNVLGL